MNKTIVICCLLVVFAPLIAADGNTTANATTNETPAQTPTVTHVTPTTTAQPATGFISEPYVVFQPVNTKITKDEHGSVELYMANPDVNDVVLHVSATIHAPPNLCLYGSFGGVAGATGVVTAKFDITPGSHKTVKALIQPTRTGVYLLGCHATYYPVGHKELASDISSSYEMTVEGIPPPPPTVTPTPEPTPAPAPKPVPGFEAMFVIAGVLGVFYLLMRQK